MLKIEQPYTGRTAFLHTGFRPFFTLASLGAVVLMLLWLGVFGLGLTGIPMAWDAVVWHAHEMIFGFGLAVVTGFLLTAVRNWTNQPTLEGGELLALALLWLVIRLMPFFPGTVAYNAFLLECTFLILLLAKIAKPIIETKQWGQMAVLGKVALLIPAAVAFHLGVWGLWPEGVNVGLYAGFYILLGLVLTLARRVMPMFIERGLNNGFMTRNNDRVDRWSLILFVAFALADTLLQTYPNPAILAVVSLLAIAQVGVHSWRLAGWYHHAVWQKPLLWVLVLAYAWLVIGFALKALVGIGWVAHSVAIHALSVGGVGLVTLGMMARVTLGHTGRNVNAPPKILGPVFALVGLAAVFRVFGVWLLPSAYGTWILLAQVAWVLGFALFVAVYLPFWIKARIDGGRG